MGRGGHIYPPCSPCQHILVLENKWHAKEGKMICKWLTYASTNDFTNGQQFMSDIGSQSHTTNTYRVLVAKSSMH